MTILQADSPFFISEAEALALIDANMDDIKGKIDASSGQNANNSISNSSNIEPGSNPCDGTSVGNVNCNCCQCA